MKASREHGLRFVYLRLILNLINQQIGSAGSTGNRESKRMYPLIWIIRRRC